MACMANITSQKAGFLGSQYLQMLGLLGGFTPLNSPTRGTAPWPPDPRAIDYPYHWKITCFNKRKQEPWLGLELGLGLRACLFLSGLEASPITAPRQPICDSLQQPASRADWRKKLWTWLRWVENNFLSVLFYFWFLLTSLQLHIINW